jgi:hypothetical protein
MRKNIVHEIAHFKFNNQDFLGKFKKRPMLYFAGATLFSLSLVGGIAHSLYRHVLNEYSYMPPRIISRLDGMAVKMCYPTIYGEPLSVKKGLEIEKTTYWEILVEDAPGFNKNLWFQTSKTKDGMPSCSWLNRKKDGERLVFLPVDVARNLALNHYQTVFADCLEINPTFSKEEKQAFCKKSISQKIMKGNQALYHEDKLALQSMGIDISNIKFNPVPKVSDVSSRY